MGSNGRTIPKPIRSMKTVRKTTSSDGLLMNESGECGCSAPRGAADNQASANLQRHARSLSAGEDESRKRGVRGVILTARPGPRRATKPIARGHLGKQGVAERLSQIRKVS